MVSSDRFNTLAVKAALGQLNDEEKIEFQLMKKSAKAEIREQSKTTPEGIIAGLRKKIAKLESMIQYVEINGELPPVKHREKNAEGSDVDGSENEDDE
jgi:hypothetical protein